MAETLVTGDADARKALEIENRAKSGARWFYWIAGLSMANSIILMSGADFNFCIGLGVTQLIDGFAFDAGIEAQTIGLMMNAMVAGMFVYLGVMACKYQPWAFVTGLVIYAADGLLFLLVGYWLGLAFHVFAFICILSGLKAVNQLRAALPKMPATLLSPVAVGDPRRQDAFR